jgi:hypothetical protein
MLSVNAEMDTYLTVQTKGLVTSFTPVSEPIQRMLDVIRSVRRLETKQSASVGMDIYLQRTTRPVMKFIHAIGHTSKPVIISATRKDTNTNAPVETATSLQPMVKLVSKSILVMKQVVN